MEKKGRNRVEPLRHLADIQRIKGNLKAQSLRDYALFVLGLNTGLRESDLLKLKLEDVLNEEGHFKHHISIRQTKTNHLIRPFINCAMREALTHYLRSKDFKPEDRLFDISPVRFHQLIKKWVKDVGLDPSEISTHSLRKSFGYHLYMKGTAIELVAYALGHKDTKTTMLYIGLSQDQCWKAQAELNL